MSTRSPAAAAAGEHHEENTMTTAPNAPVAFPISLEVTVHTDSFVTGHGLDFEDHLPQRLGEMVASDATIATEFEPDHPLALVGVEVVPARHSRYSGIIGVFGGEFTTVTVTLMVTADHDRFTGVFGADPKDVMAQFVAARLLDTALLRHNRGTVSIVTKGNHVLS
jgi:hypothetical protein